MLLSTCSSSTIAAEDEEPNPFGEYLRYASGQEKVLDRISIEHNYCKLWSDYPAAHHTKPARLLFLKGFGLRTDSCSEVSDIPLDVESLDDPVEPPYVNDTTKAFLYECDQFLTNSLPSEDSDEKETVNKTGWTTSQKTIYKHIMKILQGCRLSRLANSGSSSELVKRRISIDRSAGKIRQLFASHTWDIKLLSWIHSTLVENLSTPMLSEYFEILRTLKAKVPTLIDKMLSQAAVAHPFGNSSAEAFNQFLRKTWDPLSSALNQYKMIKLPGNPLILVVPSSPNQTVANQSQRMRLWYSRLSSLAKVIHMPIHVSSNMAVDESLNQLVTVARNKVVELRGHSPKRPTILLGWSTGALIACQIALEEPVTAVICLGFPLKSVAGSRGDLDDPLLDSKVPTLFIVGQNSSTCSMDDIEDFRERMRAETGLVVVGGADDMLLISSTKKKSDGITQSMVDRCLIDEIGEFLAPILDQSCSVPVPLQPPVIKKPISTQQQLVEDGKRPRRRPREYSPEISPVRKKARPMARPSLPKAISTSSSSDSSSVGSFVSDNISKKDKNSLHKGTKHIEKLSLKVQIPKISSQVHKKSPETTTKEKSDAELTPPETTSSSVALQPISTAKLCPAKILAEQQKNGPVDVEKAFGKDSSFLPRPLTPAELDCSDATPATQIDKPLELLGEEENQSVPSVTEALPPSSSPLDVAAVSPSSKSALGVALTSILSSPERQKISYLKTSQASYPLTSFSTHVSPTVAIQKPQVVAKISESALDSSKTGIVSSQSDETIISSSGRILKGTSVKSVHGLVASLAGKGLLTTSQSSAVSQTLVVGSQTVNRGATFLLQTGDTPSPTRKIQFRRMVVQGSSRLPMLSKMASGDAVKSSSLDQRPCNLSLLSDVAAGIKDPMQHMIQDTQVPSNATLVKLTSPNEVSKPTLRRIRVIEAIPSSSSAQRLETPEELAEKQMAIHALNSSLNAEGESNLHYNVQPSKLEGGFVPRSPSMLGYSIVMPKPAPRHNILPPFRRGRGRSTSNFPMGRRPRVQRFYPF